jgi:hypothetical protein
MNSARNFGLNGSSLVLGRPTVKVRAKIGNLEKDSGVAPSLSAHEMI